MLQHVDTVLGFAVVMLLLSLLVMTLVQMVVAVSGLRGAILKWGIERLLKQVAPTLTKEQASTAAAAVVAHPALHPPHGKPPTAIRKEELIQILDDLIKSEKSPPKTAPKTILSRARHLRPKTVSKRCWRQFSRRPGVRKWPRRRRTCRWSSTRPFPTRSTWCAVRWIEATQDTRAIVANVGAWFDTVMDRTTDLFLRYTRWFTIAVAAFLALLFQIDSLSILKQLSSDPELRARMVESAGPALSEAEKVFNQAAVDKTRASDSIRAIWPEIKEAVEDPNALADVPADLASRQDGQAWLEQLAFKGDSRQAILARYAEQYEALTLARLNELHGSVRRIRDSLQASDLTLFHNPVTAWSQTYWEDGMTIVGTLMTVVFLSLGAPFWYNTLRQLSNLRPVLAEKIDPKGSRKEMRMMPHAVSDGVARRGVYAESRASRRIAMAADQWNDDAVFSLVCGR